MNEEGTTRSGIENILDDVTILTILEREKVRKIFERELAALRNENADLRNLQSRAGQANSSRYDRLRNLCMEAYCDSCLDRITKKKLRSRLPSTSADELQKLLVDVRPPFKKFAPMFHKKADAQNWSDGERRWLDSPSAKCEADTTLHKWWKELNQDLKVVLERFPNY